MEGTSDDLPISGSVAPSPELAGMVLCPPLAARAHNVTIERGVSWLGGEGCLPTPRCRSEHLPIMRILYVSVHEPLQFDEVRLLEDLGAEVSVIPPGGPPVEFGVWRPVAGQLADWTVDMASFEAIIVMGDVPNLQRVLDLKPKGRVIWRTIGQSSPDQEAAVAALRERVEIVRYSPRERNLTNFAGEDALIRFAKDPAEFDGWTGGGGITVVSNRFGRRWTVDFRFIESALRDLPWRLFGGGNAEHPKGHELSSYADLLAVYRGADVFFSTNAIPASYTLGLIEAMMTGTPVLALSEAAVRRRCATDAVQTRLKDPAFAVAVYEAEDIVRGFGLVVDEPGQARAHVHELMANRTLRHEVGARCRERAIALFDRSRISAQWRDLLDLDRYVSARAP